MTKPIYFWNEELNQMVSSLPEADKVIVVRDIFRGMVSSMRALYLELGHTDKEVHDKIEDEVERIREVLSTRLESLGIDVDSDSKVLLEFDRSVPMDKSFTSDAKLDFDILLEKMKHNK